MSERNSITRKAGINSSKLIRSNRTAETEEEEDRERKLVERALVLRDEQARRAISKIKKEGSLFIVYTMHGEEQKCEDLARALGRVLHCDTRAPMNLDSIRLK